MDRNDRGSSDSEDMHSQVTDRVPPDGSQVKICADCGTSKTPLWRGGPAGPKSLCNACGIRSRKRRRALLGLNKDDKKSRKNSGKSNNGGDGSQSSSSSSSSSEKFGDSLKKNLVALGREVTIQRPRSAVVVKQRRKLGEEEQAAMMLMALSCGSVFA